MKDLTVILKEIAIVTGKIKQLEQQTSFGDPSSELNQLYLQLEDLESEAEEVTSWERK